MTAARVAAVLAAAAGGALSACGGGSSPVAADAPPGARVYANAGCGNCHTLRAARSSASVGANLDDRRPDARLVERWVRKGGNGMPAFEQQLNDAQIRDVARYVAQVAGP